jgi:acyl-CoA synthetase (AMP-forming)/AMP-acid ligase II
MPPVASTTLEQLFTRWVQQTPAHASLLAPDRASLTFTQMGRQLETLLESFRRLGLGRTARVALLAPNGPELALAFLGSSTSATCAPLNPAYQKDELAFYLDDLEASVLLIASSLESPAREVAKARGIPILEFHTQLDQPAGCFTLEGRTGLASVGAQAATPDNIALILHTSGTTARPKQVPLSHANLCASIRHLQQSLVLRAEDICLNLMPLFHIHGLVGALLAALGSGGRVVCPPGFSKSEFFDWLRAFQPTWYTSVPTIHQAILAQARTEDSPRASAALRFIRSSSASLPPTVMAELEVVFAVPVIEAYGMTEAAHQMASNPLPPDVRKPGSVGLPAGPEITILSEKGGSLPSGEVGEVAIKGVNVMTGYAQNPTANAQAFTDGWFRTGDQGYLDPDGYLFLTGRFKELINRGGKRLLLWKLIRPCSNTQVCSKR